MAGQSGGGAAGAGERSVFSGFSQDDSSAKELRFPSPSHVRRIITERQARSKFFDAELFADPAWDMLLDLTAAHGEGVRVSVTSLCIASGVPPTTALRWVRQMTENGLFERIDDPSDKRRAFISLSAKSRDPMSRYFALIEAPLVAAA
ncbi:winged helix DNA-binding protein [Altererythrobacter xiamenensis]|uniref:winged helix DNA-binding protein n=1 Tax=Altererythrobacter xiamenensis TaxID=1316679 RepID=UPI002E0E29A8